MQMRSLPPLFPNFLRVMVLALIYGAPWAAGAPDQPPTLQYGQEDSLPLPRSLAFSVNPDRIIADAAAWKAMGMDGFFMEGVADEWSNNVWTTDNKPHTIGASDETFQKVRRAVEVCNGLDMDIFIKTVYANPLEWFNDIAWQQICHNFKQNALFARETGCKGIGLDIEYIGQQYAFDWEGYDYQGYTREDLVRVIRQRSTDLVAAMYDVFPEMIFLVLPEESFTLGTHIETAWIEEAARRDAPGGIHLFMESTYTTDDIRRTFAQASADNQLFRRLLSPEALKYWQNRCSLASGVWPTGFDVLEHSSAEALPEQLRQSWAASLMVSPQYNWVYLDRYGEQHMGRKLDAYPGVMDFTRCAAILKEKQIALDEPYLEIARTLRGLPEENFAAELGLAPVPKFMFPYAVPMLEISPEGEISAAESEREWKVALDYYAGRPQDLQALYQPVRTWQLIGPFPSGEQLAGHNVAFPPEQGVDLAAEYEGAQGKVRWTKYEVPGKGLGIDFKDMFAPNEQVSVYAACWVDSPVEQQVQVRFSTNDAGKLWIGGKLVDDFPRESWSILDRDIFEVTLPKGRTEVLAKVTNGIGAWSLVLRFCDLEGRPVANLGYSATP